MEELVEEPKLWGLVSLTNSFDFLRSIVMNENRSFDFLKIAGHGSIIPRPYLSIFSLEKEKIEQMFCFGKKNKFQNGKNSRF